VLEIGMASGRLMEMLGRHSSGVVGCDKSANAISACVARDVKNIICCDASQLPFRDGSFNFAVASDVLEHIAEDSAAVQEWLRILKKDGRLLIFAPACAALWGWHDKLNLHFRRYNKRMLGCLLGEAHAVTEKVGYWNFFLFLPIYLVRRLERIMGKQSSSGGLYDFCWLPNMMLRLVVKFENSLVLRGLNFPIGVSVFAVARKN
jgi:SAM-dependent methyltransferase